MDNKKIGSSAGLLALLAFLLHSLLPPSGERKAEPEAAKKVAVRVDSAEKRVPTDGPWLATRQYFHVEPPVDMRSACIGYLLPPAGAFAQATEQCPLPQMKELFGLDPAFDTEQLTTLIVTIPDPLHTRMSIQTDRYLDAIQQAAFRADWELATQWLPWSSPGEDAGKAGAAANASLDLEKLPGLIVFRRHFVTPASGQIADVEKQFLLVFVAGETPTSGINGFQFEAALRAVERLRRGRIAVLGPSYSGSFLSLASLIRSDTEHRSFDIRSGNASNLDYASSLLRSLQNQDRDVTFHGSTLPSPAFAGQFKALLQRQGLNPCEAAELVEDETGFSFHGKPRRLSRAEQACDGFTPLYRYPRDISQLRNIYSDVAFSAQPQSGGAAQPLEFSLKDTQSGETSFPIFSTSHTPVSQNVVLEQIVRDLNRNKIRMVSLSATNIFDTLFLAKVLSNRCPNLRIVVNGADRLFVQEAAQGSLAGLLAFSPFPMFSEGIAAAKASDPDSPGAHDITTFPDTDSVGEYNAALDLLGHPEYREQFEPASPKSGALFATWLLVLGRTGWVPVDLFDQDAHVLQGDRKWFDESQRPKGSQDHANPLAVTHAGIRWTFLGILIALLSLGVCCYLLFLKNNQQRCVWSAFCMSDLHSSCVGRAPTRISHARYLALLSCLLSLAFVNAVMLIPMEAARWVHGCAVASPITELLCAAGFALPLGLGIRLPFLLHIRGPKPGEDVTPRFQRGSLVLYGLLLCALMVPLWVWWRQCALPGAAGSLLCLRALSMAMPLSAVWPLLLAGFTSLVLALCHLRRFSWADRQNPEFAVGETLEAAFWGQLSDAKARLDRVLASPTGWTFARWTSKRSPSNGGWLMAAVVAAAGSAVSYPLLMQGGLFSFERPVFATLFGGLFLPLGLLIAGSLIQLARSWSVLRELLSVLNSSVLGGFFSPMPDFDGEGPIWARNLKGMTLGTSVNSAIALHNLQLEDAVFDSSVKEYWGKLQTYLAPRPDRNRCQFILEFREFRSAALAISKKLAETVLAPYWQMHALPFVEAANKETKESAARPKAAGATAGGGTGGPSPASPGIGREAYEVSATYVAMQCCMFICYALRHIQNLMLCCALSFVLFVLMVNSFSFQAPQNVSRGLFLVLAIGGVVVIRVLAQIERNPIISRLSGTPGELGKEFYGRLITYGGLPVLTVLATQFPSLANFLTSWAEPTLEALK